MHIDKKPYSISQDYIHEIISLDNEPILRNLQITQCYYYISQAIAQRLGHENVNWCNFATWASKTAGRFIRLENVNVLLNHSFHLSDDYHNWLLVIKEKFNEWELDHDFGHHQMQETTLNSISMISADIAAGNLKVFSEIGPVFSLMITAFDKSLQGNYSEVDIILKGLHPGATSEGGQDLLGNAILDFHASLHETNQQKKAELILRANAQTGLHEQIRLQPYIAGALEAPLPHIISEAIHQRVSESTPVHKHQILNDGLKHLLAPICQKVHHTWLNMMTHYLMTLTFPDEVLHLGKDLPKPRGAPMFPDHLLHVQDEKLVNLLIEYEAHLNTPINSRSKNWAKLEDRMHYILKLFRSRQQHKPLHEPPFNKYQMLDLIQNKVPFGKL